ncbi:hypothetical protein, partial [Vulcanococcus sp.]|uniref:hypothetical protein n=1 Tax=Vulcanococcus sp. TaxID=2856995 RepID=UPI003C0BEF6F
ADGSANRSGEPKANAKHLEQAAGIVQTTSRIALVRLTSALLSMWTRSSNRQQNLSGRHT